VIWLGLVLIVPAGVALAPLVGLVARLVGWLLLLVVVLAILGAH
jgi:hypothetical protein